MFRRKQVVPCKHYTFTADGRGSKGVRVRRITRDRQPKETK